MGLRDAHRRLEHVIETDRARFVGLEALAKEMVADGEIAGPYRGIPHLRERLSHLKTVADFLLILVDHEPALRALDPRLTDHAIFDRST